MAMALALGPSLTGCRKDVHDVPRAETPRFERGDRVLVEPLGGEFFEGRVVAVSGDGLRVERTRNAEAFRVLPADVYRLPSVPAKPEPGRLAICDTGASWVGCRIERARGSEVAVVTLDDRSLSLAPRAVLAPTSVTELNLRQRFERRAARARFSEEALRAGEPAAPAGFRPQAQARVVAQRQGDWWTAVVLDSDVDEAEATVRFVTDGHEQVLDFEKIVPDPTHAAPPARGAYVLIRPPSAAEPWKRVRVSNTVDDDVRVVDRDGAELRVPLRDVLWLVPPPP